ncbi:Cytoskeleton protein RodZ [Tepidimonas thermarum]|uniref:Cytoskeleton protein RodZ n=1 Tax=Tepidimonas thermarum TaxID=335431 RepID=A0A554X7I4_9BURK|nr:helix-turn-helix domain-containing protein [Tepidimonas thermarum]TSE31791.1 Cytoskeleton protein RodZ [Tepidimonas thermarum]
MSEPEASTSAQTAGAQLRQAREAAGLHIATLAATLKVPVQRLEALEAGQHDALPGGVPFARALALSVCRVLKVDPAPVLEALPAGPAPRLQPASGSLDAPLPREAAAPMLGERRAGLPSVPVLIALALIALAVVLWFVLPPAEPQEAATVAVTAPLAAQESTSTAPAAAQGLGGAAPDAPTATPTPTPAPPAAPDSGAASVGTMPAPAQAAPGAATGPTAGTAGADAPAAANGVLELRASAPSWIQVVGASGKVWLQRSVQPGEAVRFDADLPLAVTVGRADATQVVVRGQPFDLAPVTRNNVARFEVR